MIANLRLAARRIHRAMEEQVKGYYLDELFYP
jgi:hypothetical protein